MMSERVFLFLCKVFFFFLKYLIMWNCDVFCCCFELCCFEVVVMS